MAEPERLEGRNGAIWRAYLEGRTQEAIAEEFGVSQQRVSQIISEVRESIPEVNRVAAALLDLERLDLLMTGMMPPALAGDPKATAAVLRILERRAKALGTDASQPLEVVLDARMDVVGQLVADALAAALDAVPELSQEQRIAALTTAQDLLFREAGGGSPEAG
ncbi:sigma factor-like helix-turn-helix DNA-binding protein [Streptomyces caniscabiei]|uniref:Sigma factor-like helix-turn-helix DNA-binding protein n=1 Tax=Streptomyces caniscabiei TaxID=2746961 RepID=A0ABU4MG31_9ACTN|nr:sigma factor-like helix-turn-helix DNA-binding protein [Streptomyces caniscabiei]MBE4789950.1 helix-turn-helix domain-containing protein [Streptomyces caniscabiei]MBE4790849.1 helix-turn-helix domain-containing protein [Streptomyces caniscabiei]MDX2943308.1 sigma factor-like helix-turn-helix DNA-binding protein [Streptomyces caniscabiei]MDX3036429.1 sigma factor-like helix-turn-helix DNA-binding protein [Streptomyces caniscabiei]